MRLSEEADSVAHDTDGEEANDDEQRVHALLQEIHAGEGHEKGNDARHEAVEDALERRHDMLAGAVVVLGKNQGHIDRGPFRHQGAHDQKTENRGTFRQITHLVAAHLIDELRALVITVHDTVPVRQEADDIEGDEENQRADDAAREGDAGTESRENRTQGAPENRVTDTGQRTDETDLDTGEGTLADVSTVCLLPESVKLSLL